MDEIVKLLGIFLGGGLVSGVASFLLGRKKNDQDGFQILKQSWKEEFERLEKKVEKAEQAESECLTRYDELDDRFTKLKHAFQIHKVSNPELPIPMWKKDLNGVMLALNDAYEEIFLFPLGKTREDYIGSKDEAIWGPEIAAEFKRNDQSVKRKGKSVRLFEHVKTAGETFEEYDIVKYPEKIDGIIVCIGGIAIPKNTKKAP